VGPISCPETSVRNYYSMVCTSRHWHSSFSFSVSDNCPQYCNAYSCEWWNGVLSPFLDLFLPLCLLSSFPLLSFFFCHFHTFQICLSLTPLSLQYLPIFFSVFSLAVLHFLRLSFFAFFIFSFGSCFLHFHIANSKLTSLCHGRVCGATKVARLKQTVFQERRFSASEWRTLLSLGSSSS